MYLSAHLCSLNAVMCSKFVTDIYLTVMFLWMWGGSHFWLSNIQREKSLHIYIMRMSLVFTTFLVKRPRNPTWQFTQCVWALPLTEVLSYSALNMVMWLKYIAAVQYTNTGRHWDEESCVWVSFFVKMSSRLCDIFLLCKIFIGDSQGNTQMLPI